MGATEPPPVRNREAEIGDRVAAAPGVCLCLDFDGTLAPIVDEPDDAAMPAETRRILDRLASRPTVTPAVVSGRQIDDLRERVPVDGVGLAGNHGLEVEYDDREVVHPAADRWRTAIREVCDELERRLENLRGSEIENKGLTATVHYRRVPAERVDDVETAVRSAVADVESDLEIHPGREIFEIRPPVDWDKGRAVELLAEETPDDWLVVFVGDDVTDEDAFEVLAGEGGVDEDGADDGGRRDGGDDDGRDEDNHLGDGIGVVVGDREPTAADYRLPDRSDVPGLLELFADRHDPDD